MATTKKTAASKQPAAEKKPAAKARPAAKAESAPAPAKKRTRQPRIVGYQKRFEIHLKDLPAEAASTALGLVRQAVDLVLGEREKIAIQKKRSTAAEKKSKAKQRRLARTLKKYKPEEIEAALKLCKE